MNQIQFIQGLSLNPDETIKLHCPFCNGRSKLYVSRRDGKILWNCFKASCSVKGAIRTDRTSVELSNVIHNKPSKVMCKSPIPDTLVKVNSREPIVKWLKALHCWQAYEDRRVDIKYSPAEDRIMFGMNDGKGYIGRSITRKLPKWRTYGDTTGCFIVPSTGKHKDTAVVVEDVPSACAVSQSFTGMALLGTNMDKTQKSQLRTYNRVFVCLDKDASKKGLRLSRQLEGYTNVRTKFLDGLDLKHLTPEQIDKFLLD
jgi:hypothetical protein